MWKYVLKRLLAMIPILIGVTFLVFMIFKFAPGEPARMMLGFDATEEAVARVNEEMGFNDPAVVQYGRYIWGVVQGDLGTSYQTKLPVVNELANVLPYTLQLASLSLLVALLIAVPIGILAAVKKDKFFDIISMIFMMLGISLPTFWIGLLGILIFSVELKWLPSDSGSDMMGLILPVITLAINSLAALARTTRSSMLTVIHADYNRTARSKGLSQREVILKHTLPNALIPTLTVAGIQSCFMISGTIMVENIFSRPGIGRLLVASIQNYDIPMALGCVILFAICFSLINLVVDILYAWVDPRIKALYTQ